MTQKETGTIMKDKKTKPAKKQAKTIKVTTLLKAAAITAAIIASFIAGVNAANGFDSMIDSEAEQRAAALLKSDGKQ